MRIVAATAAIVILLSSVAMGQDAACRWYQSGPHYTEWVEHGEQRGARIIARDPKWEIRDDLAFHAITRVVCQSCSDNQINGALLWLGVAGDLISTRGLDEWVTAESVAARLAPAPFGTPAEFHAKTDTGAVFLSGLEGRVRAIGINYRDGRSEQMIALAVAKDCLSLFALVGARDGAEFGIDQLDQFVRAIEVERYEPDFNPHVLLPPPPPDEFPLGDAFRRRYIDQP
jgi:hypothetical protein